MEIKNLFDSKVKQNIIDRVNKLTPQTQHLWGKMTVSQMLSHCQMPIGVAFGSHKLEGNFILKLIGHLFKSVLFNEKPYKLGLPTDKSFIITETKDFDLEKKLLLEKIEQFSEESLSANPHPLFGKLTNEQWSKATWKHLDHHLRQFGV